MGAKIDELSERVEGVRERMSLQRQVEQRPLVIMGISVAAGFVLQRLVGRWHHRHYRRAAPYILDQVRMVAQSTAEYVGNAARAAADSAAREAASGADTSMAPRPHRSRKVLFDIATKAVLAGLTRTVVSMVAQRLRHRDPGYGWGEDRGAPVIMDVRGGYESFQTRD